jgi:hypothetical protein
MVGPHQQSKPSLPRATSYVSVMSVLLVSYMEEGERRVMIPGYGET